MGRPKGSKNKAKVVITETKLTTELPERRKKLAALNKEQRELRPKATAIEPLGAAEADRLRKQAAIEMAKVVDPQSVVNRAIEEVIKPNWAMTPGDAAGLKHFLVNAFRHGETVSMDKEKWDFGLKQHGLRGALQASKPEAGQDLDARAVNRWRVMIG